MGRSELRSVLVVPVAVSCPVRVGVVFGGLSARLITLRTIGTRHVSVSSVHWVALTVGVTGAVLGALRAGPLRETFLRGLVIPGVDRDLMLVADRTGVGVLIGALVVLAGFVVVSHRCLPGG